MYVHVSHALDGTLLRHYVDQEVCQTTHPTPNLVSLRKFLLLHSIANVSPVACFPRSIIAVAWTQYSPNLCFERMNSQFNMLSRLQLTSTAILRVLMRGIAVIPVNEANRIRSHGCDYYRVHV